VDETAPQVEISVEGKQESGHHVGHVKEERCGTATGRQRRRCAGGRAHQHGRWHRRHPNRPKRRSFTAEFKQRILREADAALASGVDGAVGELLRREGLYSSRLFEWRQQREAGELAGLTPSKRGRKPIRSAQADEVERLERRVSQLETELKKAAAIIDVQKKLSLLLGVSLTAPSEEDLARADTGRRR
jgi:transposase